MEELKSTPVPKPTKEVKLSNSYRSVLILSPAVKISIHPTFTKNIPKADHQHGFLPLPHHSTYVQTLLLATVTIT